MGWVPFQLLYLGPFSNVRCICAFRLTVVGRLTDFEREAIRELMYQGKNLNDQVKACQANSWPSTKRKAEACLDGILATLSKLKTSNSSLL